MSEVMADPAAAEGQPAESPNASEPSPELGAGFSDPGSSDAGPAAAEGQSSEASQPSTGATAPGNDNQPAETDEEQRQGTLRYDDWTRKTMDLGDERRALAAEKQKWYADREQSVTEREERLAAPAEEQPQSRLQVAAQFEEAATMADEPEQRRGLMYMADQQRAMHAMETEVKELRAWREETDKRVGDTEKAAGELTEEQNQAIEKRITDEAKEAIGAFGSEAVDKGRNFILRNLNTVNEDTGEVYTISELVAMHSGKPLKETLEAMEKQREAASAAKRQAASTTQTHSETTAGNGVLSRAEGVAQIAAKQAS